MNAYERVMNTLQGLPVDRVPVFAVLCAYGGKLTHTDLRTLYSDATAYVAGQHALQETFGFDLVLPPFDVSAIAEAFGGEVAWFHDQVPNMKRPAALTVEDALKLPLPDPQRTARLPVILGATRQLAETYGGQTPLLVPIPGPCALPALILGMEKWMETFLFNQADSQRLLDHTGRFFVDWANALLDAGVNALIIGNPMATAEISSRDLFAERLLPHIHAIFAQVRGPIVFHHTGGRINHILDLLPGLPSLVGVSVSSKDDLAEARRLLGPELLLIGNLDNLGYPEASDDEIYERSLVCLQIGAPAGRYILANSGGDIPLSTPPENLRAMIAASMAYSAGPGSNL